MLCLSFDVQTLFSFVEILRIDVAGRRNVREKMVEMNCHRAPRSLDVMAFDSVQHSFVLNDDLCHPPPLRKRQPTITIDVKLDLLNEFPDSGVAGDIGNGGVKHFVCLMEGLAVFGIARLALALQD